MANLTTRCLVRGLAAELDGIATYPLDTPSILAALERMGHGLNLETYTDAPRLEQMRGPHPEYLWDMSWWRDDSCMVLACESEWGRPRSVCYDCSKLLLATAPWKLLITDASQHGGRSERLRPTIQRKLKEHDDHRTSETYVWIDFRCNRAGGIFRAFEFVPTRDGRLDNPVFREVDGCSFKYLS